MGSTLEAATPNDAPAIAALRTAAATALTSQFGSGPWSSAATERGVLFDIRNSHPYVMRERGQIVATLVLATKKPWAIDRSYFTPVKRPLYLVAMAVAPSRQRRGIGRRCLESARQIAQRWPAQAICLDAWDAVAGAGEFYRKCGFREVGRATYRTAPLIYFELLV